MDNLPEELLYKIFKHLPQKDLLKCSTVCKLFNEIIESYNLISTLVIHQDYCDSSLSALKRKYSKVIIKDKNEVNIEKALQITGESIREVKFDHHLTSLEVITKTLNLMPNIQVVTFYYIRLENDEDEEVANIVQAIPQNITVNFYESDPQVFKVLLNLSLIKLEIIFYGDSPYYNCNDLFHFMKKQKHLKSIHLGGLFESNLMYGNILKGSYQLTDFSLKNCELEEWIYLENYLNDHVNTIEKLTFHSLRSWDPSIIIKACPKLKVLDLHEVEINEINSNITSVKELAIQNPNQAISKFTNLEKMFIENASVEVNREIIGTNIKDLTVRYGNIEEIQCPKLKKLNLMNIDGPLTEDFFRTHSSVEDLELESYFFLNDELLEMILSKLSNLKVLSIYGMNNLTLRAFEIIEKYCKHLRVLDMKIWSQKYSITDWKRLFESNQGIEIYVENFF